MGNISNGRNTNGVNYERPRKTVIIQVEPKCMKFSIGLLFVIWTDMYMYHVRIIMQLHKDRDAHRSSLHIHCMHVLVFHAVHDCIDYIMIWNWRSWQALAANLAKNNRELLDPYTSVVSCQVWRQPVIKLGMEKRKSWFEVCNEQEAEHRSFVWNMPLPGWLHHRINKMSIIPGL